MSESLCELLRRYLFGKPDGTFIALRCRLLGHRFEWCTDDCCEGYTAWCRWCAGSNAHA